MTAVCNLQVRPRYFTYVRGQARTRPGQQQQISCRITRRGQRAALVSCLERRRRTDDRDEARKSLLSYVIDHVTRADAASDTQWTDTRLEPTQRESTKDRSPTDSEVCGARQSDTTRPYYVKQLPPPTGHPQRRRADQEVSHEISRRLARPIAALAIHIGRLCNVLA